MADHEPDLHVDDGEVETRLWHIDDQEAIAAMQEALVPTQLLIADGHHRYETALAFHEEDGSPESGYTFAVLVNINSEGLAIFPTHRSSCTRRPRRTPGSRRRAGRERRGGAGPHQRVARAERPRSTGAARHMSSRRISASSTSRWSTGSASKASRTRPTREEAVADVDGGVAELAVLLRAPRVDEVLAAAAAGRVMPPKSTYFYPKLVSGLLFHPL